MSTFMFNINPNKSTQVSNIFIDKFMPKAKGEYVKIYLLGLKYCMSGELGASSSIIANVLHLSETDVIDAWNYWNEEGLVQLTPIDSNGNYKIDFLDISENNFQESKNVNLLKELNNDSIKDMLQDIEKLLGRPLSSKEMSMYLGWQKDYNFSPELILLLIQYAVSKGKTDYRYIEKIAIAWHDSKIRSIDDAQLFIKKHEDKWINIRKILTYLGVNSTDIMKPQEQMLDKWLNVYNFQIDIIYKACDICFERLNKPEFKYIDGILNSWFKDSVKSLEDIEKLKKKKSTYKNNNTPTTSKGNFGDYEQRSYNFDELEKKLLGWDNNA